MKKLLAYLLFLTPLSWTIALPYPADSGILNVRLAPYHAVGDGIADDTAALQQAIVDADATGRIIYLPNGIYRITNRLLPTTERYYLNIEGESRDGTIIRLDANAQGFGNANQPRAVLQTVDPALGWTNNAFMTNIADLTIEIGAGNPGAVGILFIGNNQASIRDVTVRSLDPAGVGHTAIDMSLISLPGPGFIHRVRTEGFDCGVRIDHSQYGITLENVDVIQPRVVGIDIRNTILTGRKLNVSTNNATIPAIRIGARGMGVILDSFF
ncbi:MAG: glycoside hydrolase family 55 protein [Verrucomicrobia bacterium]|nr:glycoside hydrolase family 55 protein [Verrucomicrobiota bacterium]